VPETDLGRIVGRYRIVQRIGEGGMGVVYEAVDTTSNESVALKKLREIDKDRSGRRLRFAREAKLGEAIDHPGIVRVIEVVLDGDELFIAMELVAGVSLRARLDELAASGKTMETSAALRIAAGIASAVAHAHRKGVIHRDLKPENVMLVGDETRVLDFGLAKLREIDGGMVYDAETESNVTEAGHVLGTPAYMAPEQARGKEIGFRADVFSVGIVLYEMLAGQRPFVGGSTIDVIAAITRDDPPRPSEKNASLPASVDDLVMRCLAKKADARPSMQELAEWLQRLECEPVRARVTSASSKRARWLFGALGVAALASVAALAMRGRDKPTATTAASAATAPTALTDLPLPRSDAPEALAAYRTALQDERNGAEDASLLELERATKVEPSFAAAHLRLAVRLAFIEAQNARTHFAQAVANRDRLSARDAEWLDVVRSIFQRDPPDVNAWAAGLASLAQRHPGDAELALEVAKSRDALGDFRGERDAASRAVALDSGFALALATLSQAQAYLGDFAAARATIARCVAASPSASWCMWVGEFIDGEEGRCDANEKSARDRIAVDPTIPDGYKALAFALAALDRPESAVREASDQAVLRTPEGFSRQRFALNMKLRIALVHGDFEKAEAASDELETLLQSRADVGDHAMPTWVATQIETELGHDERAASIAKSFLDRKDVWQLNPIANDYALANDLTPLLLSVTRHAGTMSAADYDTAMTAWRKKWDAALHGDWRPYLWTYGYADAAETPEEGKAAVDALASFGAIPPFLIDGDLPEGGVGRALLLGGRPSEAVAHLKRAAGSCNTVTHPIAWVRAHASLGDALATTGDTAGACAAYAFVLARWGTAPRSVTASHARDRMRVLGCKPR
jgi:tetratricopeptide (TPR) repeat protein